MEDMLLCHPAPALPQCRKALPARTRHNRIMFISLRSWRCKGLLQLRLLDVCSSELLRGGDSFYIPFRSPPEMSFAAFIFSRGHFSSPPGSPLLLSYMFVTNTPVAVNIFFVVLFWKGHCLDSFGDTCQ